MRAEVGVERAPGGRRSRAGRGFLRAVGRRWRLWLWAGAVTLVGLIAAGVLFAGSPERIPSGVTLAGVPLGGLTAEQAEEKLRERAAEVASTPVVFTAGENRWALTPRQLEVRVDWAAAVQEALEVGHGPLPLRGLKRVKVRLFGEDLEPHADYFEGGLQFRVDEMARRIERPAREAAIVLRGLSPVVVPAGSRPRARSGGRQSLIIAALAGFERTPVELPVRVDEPEVEAAQLAPVADQVRTALSAPVRIVFNGAQITIRASQLAPLLDLPRDGRTQLRVGGPCRRAVLPQPCSRCRPAAGQRRLRAACRWPCPRSAEPERPSAQRRGERAVVAHGCALDDAAAGGPRRGRRRASPHDGRKRARSASLASSRPIAPPTRAPTTAFATCSSRSPRSTARSSSPDRSSRSTRKSARARVRRVIAPRR